MVKGNLRSFSEYVKIVFVVCTLAVVAENAIHNNIQINLRFISGILIIFMIPYLILWIGSRFKILDFESKFKVNKEEKQTLEEHEIEGKNDKLLSYHENLNTRKKEINEEIFEDKKIYARGCTASVCSITFGIFFVILSFLITNNSELVFQLRTLASILILGGFVFLFSLFGIVKPRILSLQSNVTEIDEELDLHAIDEVQHEKRAEIQFKNHQKEIKRYYDINLSQLKFILPLGIGIIILGSVVILMSIFIFRDVAHENIMPVVIGTVSGLLIDFIGAIFIKMYVETTKVSTEFHNQLIRSNNNLFANALVTKISDDKLKDETFSEIAKLISTTR